VTNKLFITKAAKSDLKSIGKYTKELWGIEQRDIYLAKIFQCFDELLKFPLSGKQRNELYQGMHSINIEKHVIYYYYTDNNIQIAAILHGQMEPALHLH
jgi:toxin ParE1/3/4